MVAEFEGECLGLPCKGVCFHFLGCRDLGCPLLDAVTAHTHDHGESHGVAFLEVRETLVNGLPLAEGA